MTSARVLKGADLLDFHFGNFDWRSEIDTDTLILDDAYRCILGQLFGSYMHGMTKLRLFGSVIGNEPKSFSHGFATIAWNANDWQRLEYEWKQYLTEPRV